MKKQRKDWKRISASALLAGTMVLSNLGTVIPVQASDTGVSVQDAGENLSDLEPAAWSNPIVQSYEADMEHPWKLTSWTDTSLEGSISCDQEGWLFTTIPYDTGWKVLVDGKEQETEKILDSFVSIRLTPGPHTVAMKYTPNGLIPGAVVSAVSAMCLALIAAGGYFLRRYRDETDER